MKDLSSVIRSREHLFSAILDVNIQKVFVSKRKNFSKIALSPSSPLLLKKKTLIWHYFVYAGSSLISAFIVSFSLLLIFTFCFINWRIDWNQLLYNNKKMNKKIKGIFNSLKL